MNVRESRRERERERERKRERERERERKDKRDKSEKPICITSRQEKGIYNENKTGQMIDAT